MAAIDYHGIKAELKRIIEEDDRTHTANVFIEPGFMWSVEQTPWVGIYAIGRTAPEPQQTLAAGTRMRYHLRHLLIVIEQHMDGYPQAAERRDSFLGALELVIMDNRTIGGTVVTTWIDGGEMGVVPPEDGGGFISHAEIEIVSDVVAIV